MANRWMVLYRGTAAEHAMEDAIAELGVPYRTQFPLFLYGARYFPDFLLPTLNLVVEVDDPSHKRDDKKAADAARDGEIWKKFGWRTIRITNRDALTNAGNALKTALAGLEMWPINSRRSVAVSLPRTSREKQRIRRTAKAALRAVQRARLVKSRAPLRTPPSP